MKPLKQRQTPRAGVGTEDDAHSSATQVAPQGPSQDARPAAMMPRPSLLRSPPGRLSDLGQSIANNEDGGREQLQSAEIDGATTKTSRDDSKVTKDELRTVDTEDAEDERMAQLRETSNARTHHQERAGLNHTGSFKKLQFPSRPSPIREEEGTGISPSIPAAFASPSEAISRKGSAASTAESTGSSKTVRASVTNTPAGTLPAHTPSYPFPFVPGTPNSWSSSFHQPFMTLSPTVAAKDGQEGRDSMVSGDSTPAGNNAAFLRPETLSHGPEDARFPTPALYDLVLQLNSEPGPEPWWTAVTNMMHDDYKAERVSLIMPVDPTDIENVPWGQKATFNMNGPEKFVSPKTVLRQTLDSRIPTSAEMALTPVSRKTTTESFSNVRPQKLHPERLRPRMESRHSYAGHGRDMAGMPHRPPGPQRTVTHAAGVPGGVGPGRALPPRFPSSPSITQHGSLCDPDFSSVAGAMDAGPYAEVFPRLQPLDHEARPLIKAVGINKVLERGKVVAVTRDYLTEHPESRSSSGMGLNETETEAAVRDPVGSRGDKSNAPGNKSTLTVPDHGPSLQREYEEYEQPPTSPWSQSPAPSPAIQADEEANPFFTSGTQQVEDSFNHQGAEKDYSQLGLVEAIGIERASTVIHIPLIHPTLSTPMQSLKLYNAANHRTSIPSRQATFAATRKAPIAIISILTSAVPYPSNLTQSLKLLGPHLATSFAISQQFSLNHMPAVSIRHRRTASGRQATVAPMTIVPSSLENIVNADIENPESSLSDSVTSPSDCSGRSRYSPTGSIAGTPGWDPAAHGWTASKSLSGTPALTGTEMFDNYFETKKRSVQRSSGGAFQVPHGQARQQQRGSGPDSKSTAHQKRAGEDETISFQGDRRTSGNSTSLPDDTSPMRESRGDAQMPQQDSPLYEPSLRHQAQASAQNKGHSKLHSYGADFQSSFGALPSAARDAASFVSSGHTRKGSGVEDIAPPSERLLRTIIDSVPVQIFTAEPVTGRLTWVNSKFIIYRGKEVRQVLHDPWQAIHPDDRTEFMTSWHRSLRTEQQLQQKVRLARFDNSYRWFYVRAATLKDKRSTVVHWIGTMMDFHEQHIAEINLARQHETAASEAKYRALANSSPQIVFAVDRSHGLTFCNSQWLHFSGQEEQQALGAGFLDFVHPDDLAKCRLPVFEEGSSLPKNVPVSMPPDINRHGSSSAGSSSGSSETEVPLASSEATPSKTPMPQRKLSKLAGTGILKISRDVDGKPSYSTEVRLKSREGDYRWHLVRVLLAETTLQGQGEETWYGTCTDINDHKTLERDLKETMDEKSRFLSNMSHEIRTPLNGITGMVNFLIDSDLTAEQMEHVNIIRASTEGLRGLINDILDLSKAEAGMIQLSYEWLHVRALIEEVNDLTSAMAIDKGLELNYLVQENVPAQIKGDRFRIRQILLNIVGNAIKFTSTGEVFVRCSLHSGDQHELSEHEIFIKFDTVDTGVGFTDLEADHLFKRFSQIDGSSTRQHGGTGLGLVISRQLAQLHGGDMSARGASGKGSTFTFTIKTSVPSKDDQPSAPPPTPGPNQGPNMSTSSTTPDAHAAIPLHTDKLARSKFGIDNHTQSPSPYGSPGLARDSPSVSSASSNPSLRSVCIAESIRSERSSASSCLPDPSASAARIKLALPSGHTSALPEPNSLPHPSAASPPPMFSILVVCKLKYSCEATVEHIDKTLPNNIPHQITAPRTLGDAHAMLDRDDPVIFTHIVVALQDVDEITYLMRLVLESPAQSAACMLIITDLAQRRRIMQHAPNFDYEKLTIDLKLRFIFKPLKPSRFAAIFDPQKEREMSFDRNKDSAQQVALTQKQVFDDLSKRLGNRDKRVLLVEDNKTNQLVSIASKSSQASLIFYQVVLKFLSKVSINADIAVDGVECTDKVFANPHGYYSIVSDDVLSCRC